MLGSAQEGYLINGASPSEFEKEFEKAWSNLSGTLRFLGEFPASGTVRDFILRSATIDGRRCRSIPGEQPAPQGVGIRQGISTAESCSSDENPHYMPP